MEFFGQEALNFLALGQFQLVFGYEQLIIHAGQRKFRQRMFLVGAQQDANGRVVFFQHHVPLIPTHVGVELANVLMAELGQLQFYQHMTFQDTVVKNQVDEIVLVANQDAFLSRLKAEAVTQLQQEFLDFTDKVVFQMGLAHYLARRQPQELEHLRVAHR